MLSYGFSSTHLEACFGGDWIICPACLPTTPEKPDKPETPDIPEEPGKNTPPGADNPDDWVLNGRPDKNAAPNPDNPDDWVLNGRPTLPQTGQLNWPIPVLTAAGTCLIAAGILLRKKH